MQPRHHIPRVPSSHTGTLLAFSDNPTPYPRAPVTPSYFNNKKIQGWNLWLTCPLLCNLNKQILTCKNFQWNHLKSYLKKIHGIWEGKNPIPIKNLIPVKNSIPVKIQLPVPDWLILIPYAIAENAVMSQWRHQHSLEISFRNTLLNFTSSGEVVSFILLFLGI